MFRGRQLLTVAALGALARFAHSKEDRRAFLIVRGNIRKFTDEKAKGYRFSEEEFMSLPQSSITTSTTWTTRSRFDGPLLANVLKHIGASGSRLDVQALDDYSASIPMSDLQAFSPILAHSRDGKRMTARDHGPLFVMYPRDKYPSKLNTPPAQAKFIWQVRRIHGHNRLIEYVEMFRGTIDQTSVYPREVVKEALRLNTAAVIFSHNHPDGNPKPSRADEALTYTLRGALATVDVRVLDHVIVAGTSRARSPSMGCCEQRLWNVRPVIVRLRVRHRFRARPPVGAPPGEQPLEVAVEDAVLEFLADHRAMRGTREVEPGVGRDAVAFEVGALQRLDAGRGQVTPVRGLPLRRRRHRRSGQQDERRRDGAKQLLRCHVLSPFGCARLSRAIRV